MKLILNSDVKSLGRKGDVVDVAKGCLLYTSDAADE